MDGMVQIIQICPQIKTIGSFKRSKSGEKEVTNGDEIHESPHPELSPPPKPGGLLQRERERGGRGY